MLMQTGAHKLNTSIIKMPHIITILFSFLMQTPIVGYYLVYMLFVLFQL